MILSPGHTVLIVEDDEAVRSLLADMLELKGFRTLSACNGIEGLAAAKARVPSVVISDVAMPGMGGLELLSNLRATRTLRSVPVILISARIERAVMRRGMELGADDYITKPFTQDEVVRSITARLERKELLDELDAFCHTVAHDLRNPLQNLTAQLDLMSVLWEQGRIETAQSDLTEAIRSAWRLNSVIDELLVFAGVRRRQAVVTSEPLDMDGVVDEALGRVGELLRCKEARVRRPALWPVALGESSWLVHVWTNYLSNAANHGGAAPEIVLGGELREAGKVARFWVQDDGPGLDDDGLRKVCVPLDRASSESVDGHGIGLTIVRRIIGKLGGRVGVDSQVGTGARFWFELPAAGSVELGSRIPTDPRV